MRRANEKHSRNFEDLEMCQMLAANQLQMWKKKLSCHL